MRERLIDVKKLYAFCLVVKFDSLPTGDLAKKGGSGKAPQHQHRVAALGEVTDVYRPAHIIEDTQIRQRVADLGPTFKKPGNVASRTWPRRLRITQQRCHNHAEHYECWDNLPNDTVASKHWKLNILRVASTFFVA